MQRVSKDVLSRTVDGEEVILDLSSQLYFGLNPPGTRIWELLRQGLDPSEITATLCEEFDVTRAQAARDAEEFIRTLQEKGLVEAA